jgi:hypothetical protein
MTSFAFHFSHWGWVGWLHYTACTRRPSDLFHRGLSPFICEGLAGLWILVELHTFWRLSGLWKNPQGCCFILSFVSHQSLCLRDIMLFSHLRSSSGTIHECHIRHEGGREARMRTWMAEDRNSFVFHIRLWMCIERIQKE